MCKILVMGYDRRSRYLYELLLDKNSKYDVEYITPRDFNFANISKVDYKIIFLPIPTKIVNDNVLKGYGVKIDDMTECFKDAKYVYATINKCPALDKVKGISLLEKEDFVLKNAYLTAKAAIEIADNIKSLDGISCMVVGNGRIGRYLCKMLMERDAEITLVSKSYADIDNASQYARCIDYGEIVKYLDGCDIILNTAPYNYFTYHQLNEYSGAYLELASKPYGFKYYGGQLPESVELCPSLPGKYYPREAAKIIYDSFVDFIAKG